jgi:serine protease DegQ
VVEGSAAAKAGVKAGDVIVALDGEAIRSAAELRNKVGLAPADKTIRLELLREGVLHSVSATLIPR